MNFNTAFDVHQEIYNTKQQFKEKESEYTQFLELYKFYELEQEKVNKKLQDINVNINSLNNYLNYNSDTTYHSSANSIKDEYIKQFNEASEELSDIRYHFDTIEKEIEKLNIQFNAYEIYIENLEKMIPRINRWANINNKTQEELYWEAIGNYQRFQQQLSIINYPPPKLERC